MKISDWGRVETEHWSSVDHVQDSIDRQGIASMLAFDGERCVGQLYLKQYDPGFCASEGWPGPWAWADFQPAEPLGLQGSFLALSCYHVGWLPNGTWNSFPTLPWDSSLWGRGIGTALLKTVLQWVRHRPIQGLVSWSVVDGSKELLSSAGQMPHTTYQRFGFSEIKQVHMPEFGSYVRRVSSTLNFDISDAREDPSLLRVMLLRTPQCE